MYWVDGNHILVYHTKCGQRLCVECDTLPPRLKHAVQIGDKWWIGDDAPVCPKCGEELTPFRHKWIAPA